MTTTDLRAEFESLNRDSYGFRRSRKGNYVNPVVQRDWRWFVRGVVRGETNRTLRKAPWLDFAGGPIYDGDMILHPNGERGRVVYCADGGAGIFPQDVTEGDRWRVVYSNATVSRLCLQIGDKGCAIVVRRNLEQP